MAPVREVTNEHVTTGRMWSTDREPLAPHCTDSIVPGTTGTLSSTVQPLVDAQEGKTKDTKNRFEEMLEDILRVIGYGRIRRFVQGQLVSVGTIRVGGVTRS